MAGGKDEDVSSMARFELAQLDDRMGQGDEAEKLYQQLMTKPGVFVAKPVVMLALAEHYGQKIPRKQQSFTDRSSPIIPTRRLRSKPTRNSVFCPANPDRCQPWGCSSTSVS